MTAFNVQAFLRSYNEREEAKRRAAATQARIESEGANAPALLDMRIIRANALEHAKHRAAVRRDRGE